MKASRLTSALLTLVLGILFVMMKGRIVQIAITVLGVALLLVAVIDFVKKRIPFGVCKAVLGIAVLLLGWLLLNVTLIVLGVVLLAYSAFDLIRAIVSLGKSGTALSKAISIINPVIAMMAGVMLVLSSGQMVDWAVLVAGIFLIIDGALGMVDSLMKH